MADDTPILGRKIFFLNAQFIIKNKVLKGLVDNEYEVYSFNNPKKAKGILRKYPYSILYINVDEGYPIGRWIEFISWLENDPALSSVYIGITSAALSSGEKERIAQKTKLEAGIVDLSTTTKDPLIDIVQVLEQKQAKGKRKYVRCNCVGTDDQNHVVIHSDGRGYKLRLVDVSVAGISLEINESDGQYFKPRAVLRSVFVTLGGSDFNHPAVVFGVKKVDDKNLLILLFLPGLTENVKAQIHRYILDISNSKLRMLLDEIDDETPFLARKGGVKPSGAVAK